MPAGCRDAAAGQGLWMGVGRWMEACPADRPASHRVSGTMGTGMGSNERPDPLPTPKKTQREQADVACQARAGYWEGGGLGRGVRRGRRRAGWVRVAMTTTAADEGGAPTICEAGAVPLLVRRSVARERGG
jgi:hypothetical protein